MQAKSRFHALAVVPALAFLPLAAQADEATAARDDGATPLLIAGAASADSLPLNPVVVTATRTDRRLDDSLSSVTLVDRASIERQRPREVGELLRGRPGVDVVSNGPFGKATSVFLRGTSNNQSILLMDGVRMGSATTGGPSWQFLPPAMIDRVEIVRGPRSSVYGADAIGGVIEVFTAEGRSEPSPWAELSAGSFGTHQYGSGISGRQGDTSYNIGVSHFHTDGIALQPGGDEKGYYNTSFLGRIKQGFDNGGSVAVNSLRSEGRTQFIGGETDFVHQSAGASLDLPLADHWDSELSVGESRDEAFNTFEDELRDDTRFDTSRQSMRWQNTVHADSQEYVIGVDYLEDQVESSTDYAETRRSNLGTFIQANVDFYPFAMEMGLRNDDNDAYGKVTTGSLAGSYRFSDNHRMRLTFGEGFRAPTFNELYFPGFGNPDLEPEESMTVELGISAHHERWYWDAVAYQTSVDNLIETVFVGGLFEPRNVAEARIRGLEFGTGADMGEWTIYGAASYTDPEDRETGNRLRRRTSQSARVELDRSLGDWSVGATLVAQGHRYNDAEEEERLAGFGLLNLRLGWQFAADWSARLVVDNALDKDYVTARDSFNDFDYQQPGRSVFLSLRYGRGND